MSDETRTLPVLLTLREVADFLRTTPKAVQCLHDRQRLPGVVKLGGRLLVLRDELLSGLKLAKEDTDV